VSYKESSKMTIKKQARKKTEVSYKESSKMTIKKQALKVKESLE
jgi:hypothetical protein